MLLMVIFKIKTNIRRNIRLNKKKIDASIVY